MKFLLLLLSLTPWLLVSCKTQHRVSDDSLNQTRVGGEKLLEEKFAGNWKPEDAAWYSAPGETNSKKIAEREKMVKRSQFQKVVSDSRGHAEEKGKTQWDKRANYEKEWSGSKKKKTFAWPWQKSDLKQKESTMAKAYTPGERTSREGAKVAREGTETVREGDKSFGTQEYKSGRSEIEKKEQWQAAKPEMHKDVKIIEDRSQAKDEGGWSISDIRKFLNKN
jgi:hypothetical protein